MPAGSCCGSSFFRSSSLASAASLAHACRFLLRLVVFSARLLQLFRRLWPMLAGPCCGSPFFRLVCCSCAASLPHGCRFSAWHSAFSARLLQLLPRLWPMPAGSCCGSPFFRLVCCSFFGVSSPCLPVLVVARRFFRSFAAAVHACRFLLWLGAVSARLLQLLRHLWPAFAGSCLGSYLAMFLDRAAVS